MSSKLNKLIPKLRGGKKESDKRVQATIERPKIDNKTKERLRKTSESSQSSRKSRDTRDVRDVRDTRDVGNSFLEFSEMSMGSDLQYNSDSDISELSS